MNKECEICGSTKYVQKYGGILLCAKHRHHMERYGEIHTRTNKDRNIIIKYETYAEIIIENKKCKEIAKCKISLNRIDKIKNHRWRLIKTGYVVTNIDGNPTKINRIILGIEDSNIKVDHINRDKLDNQDDNLRVCTNKENCRNESLGINNTSGIIGVSWNRFRNKWESRIMVDRKNINLGRYSNINIAILKRLLGEIKYFGEFAPQKHLILGGEYMKLQDLVDERDKQVRGSQEWENLNDMKNDCMISTKPSTNEDILYFDTNDLSFIKEKFTIINNSILNNLYNLPQKYNKRCNLEYNNDLTKHPIPYVIIKYKNKYFFILRESGSGEVRLHGLKGMIGGHISIEDKSDKLKDTIIKGFMREVYEETHITDNMIISNNIKGIIKSYDNNTDIDHLGIIYEVEITTDNIKAEEDGVLSGIWIDKKDLSQYYDKFESWSKIVFDNLLKIEE